MGLHNMRYKLEKLMLLTILCLALFSASAVTQANTQSDISPIPLSVAMGVPANIVFTLSAVN